MSGVSRLTGTRLLLEEREGSPQHAVGEIKKPGNQ